MPVLHSVDESGSVVKLAESLVEVGCAAAELRMSVVEVENKGKMLLHQLYFQSCGEISKTAMNSAAICSRKL